MDSHGNHDGPGHGTTIAGALSATAGSTSDEELDLALGQLAEWYDAWRTNPDCEAARYVVCVGLAVLHRMRDGWPMAKDQYVSGLDVRTSGPLIRNILAEFGIYRLYASAGGRTSGASIHAAQDLVGRMNALAVDWDRNAQGRNNHIDRLQQWLVVKVETYFREHPIPEPSNKERTAKTGFRQ